MPCSTPLPRRLALTGAIALILGNLLAPAPAQAGWWWPPSWFAKSNNWGPPSGNHTGAAQRSGSCPKVDMPLTALAPSYRAADGQQFVLGATASDYPTLWFYLPYSISALPTGDTAATKGKLSAELRIEEQNEKTKEFTQRTVLTLPETRPGVIGVRVPATEPPLEVGKTYHWLLVVRCSAEDTSANQFTEVSLHRVQPPVAIATPSPKQQLDFYTQNGLWAETMNLCDRLRHSPGDKELSAAWSQTIQAVPFNGIDAQQIVNSCAAGTQVFPTR